LSAKPRRDAPCILQPEEHAPFPELFGSSKLILGDQLGKTADLAQRSAQRLVDTRRLDPSVDHERAGILVFIRIRMNVVGQALFFPDLQKEPRAHSLTENDIQQLECITVGVKVRKARKRQAEVRLLRILRLQPYT